ncbi:hypothetical protein BAE44_0003436 [Dichanthelium oligosanthes]|uniref:Uncharacterized protein n=1 Tax=Dichanthelium oligosanthes TaxID=888268 RepID=A0A1E5WDS2_9POAL|nr:hypothetical protein BAE44_0003436 [Dichanthelium oligosanthes]
MILLMLFGAKPQHPGANTSSGWYVGTAYPQLHCFITATSLSLPSVRSVAHTRINTTSSCNALGRRVFEEPLDGLVHHT